MSDTADDYSDFGGLPNAMRAFVMFPMDPRMRRMLLNGADAIESLQAELEGCMRLAKLGRKMLDIEIVSRQPERSDDPAIIALDSGITHAGDVDMEWLRAAIIECGLTAAEGQK